MKSPFEFKQHGQGGLRISELFPKLAGHADDLCLLNGMHSSVPAHPQSFLQLHTGSFQFVRPSMGAWVLYGLGTENQNLPGFVVLTSAGGGQGQPISARQWHNGFLDSKYQGVKLNSVGDPVYYVGSPDGVSTPCQSEIIEAVNCRFGDSRPNRCIDCKRSEVTYSCFP